MLGSSLGKERKGIDSSSSSSFITPVGMKSFGFLNDSVTDVPWYRQWLLLGAWMKLAHWEFMKST